MNRTLIIILVASLFSGFQNSANGDIVSTFDSDNEGWTTFQNAGAFVGHSATGGNPGGYITATDHDNRWTYIQAPSNFLVPATYDGSLSFDLRAFTSDPANWPVQYNVRASLVGNGLTLINELGLPDDTWTNYDFTLNETAGWRIFSNLDQNYSAGAPQPTQAEMQSVLANLSGLFIATDYNDGTTIQGVTDESHLDNVRLTAVPEPSGLSIFVVTTALLLVRRQRSSSN